MQHGGRRPGPRPPRGDAGPAGTLARDAISAFTHAPVAVAVCRPDGVVTRVNHAMTQLLGRPPADLLDRDLFRFVPADLVEDAVAACTSLQDGSADTVVHETRFTTASGGVIDVRVTTSAVRAPDSGPPHAIMHLEDITERVELRRRLEHQASHDDLTGLPNRAHFLGQLHRAQARSDRHRQPFTVLYLDLDDFKTVNDTHGHAAGDQLLVAFADHLRRSIRPEDTAARLGGDEFVVLCEGTTREGAAQVLARLTVPGRHTWAQGVAGTAGVSVSAGSATSVVDRPGADPEAAAAPTSPEALLHAADQAMYASKSRPQHPTDAGLPPGAGHPRGR